MLFIIEIKQIAWPKRFIGPFRKLATAQKHLISDGWRVKSATEFEKPEDDGQRMKSATIHDLWN